MLNGKFYTGLTANQMNRVRGPDRQKSSFFWPDETDTVPSPNNRSGRARPAAANNQSPAVAKSSTAPSTPAGADASAHAHRGAKDLFHKQLTSNIGFYDNDTQQPRRGGRPSRPSKMDDLKALHQDISDIAEQIDKPRPRAAASSHTKSDEFDQDDSRARRNTEKTTAKAAIPTSKKISFHEPATKKGILKNNEQRASAAAVSAAAESYSVDQIPTYKKNITPTTRRIQLSKSMDNVTRLAKAESVTKRNNVEHEKTVHRQKFEGSQVESDDNYEPEFSANSISYQEEHNDAQTNHGRNVNYSMKEEAQAEWSEWNGEQSTQRTKQHINQQHKSSVINNTGRYHNEDYQTRNHKIEVQRFEEHRSTTPPPHPSIRSNDDVGYAKHYAHVAEATTHTGRRPVVSSTQHGAGGRSAAINHNHNKVYPNEAAVRAQSHLRSNIFFGDNDIISQSVDSDRPRSVRQSAVARVGVGLPNI